MQVVVNSGFLSGIYQEEYTIFLSKAFQALAKNHPEHKFIFLCEKEHAHLFKTGPNTIVDILKHVADNPLLWKYWYDIKLPRLLRKHQADIFVSPNGFCSLTARQPQCMIVHDLAFIRFPTFFTKARRLFYKRYMGKFIKKASRIIALTSYSKEGINKYFETGGTKIDIVYTGVDQVFKPVCDQVKKEIKDKYTDGKDFFIYHGPIHPSKNLVSLLKAFSLFKKRQQSNMKLMLCGKEDPEYKSFSKSLLTYKYRSDVVNTGMKESEELAAITASAYALVYPVYFDAFSMPVLQSLRCGVPVITTGNSVMQEIAGDGALYADPSNYTDLAEQLIRLYKDENKRNELIKMGALVAEGYSWDKTAEQLWLSIQKTSGGF